MAAQLGICPVRQPRLKPSPLPHQSSPYTYTVDQTPTPGPSQPASPTANTSCESNSSESTTPTPLNLRSAITPSPILPPRGPSVTETNRLVLPQLRTAKHHRRLGFRRRVGAAAPDPRRLQGYRSRLHRQREWFFSFPRICFCVAAGVLTEDVGVDLRPRLYVV